MAHIFPLEAILRVRQHREDAEERSLAALGAQRQQVEATLSRVRQQLGQWSGDRRRETNIVATGALQHGIYARLAVLREAEQALEAQLTDLRHRCVAQQAAYLAARRDRETLTELKQAQRVAAQQAEQRRDQRRLEDLILSRWSR